MMTFYFFPYILMMMQSYTQPVRLGNYYIDPRNKTVSVFQYFERDERNGNHVWGEELKPDTKVDFATTCLYVGYGLLEFKEYYVRFKLPLDDAFDEDNKPVDAAQYKAFGNFFERDGKYYYISLRWVDDKHGYKHLLRQLDIKPNVDFAKLTPAGSNYYYDSKGLYFLKNEVGYDSKQLIRIASANNCTPVMKKLYCEYNGTAYYAGRLAELEGPKKIDASPNQLVEIDPRREFNGNSIAIGDGKILIAPYQPIRKDTLGINKWTQLTAGEEFKVVDNCVYLVSSSQKGNNNAIYATPQGFVAVNSQLKIMNRYDKVFIINFDKGAYEEIDLSKFEMYEQEFTRYKGKPHYRGIPIAGELDVSSLKYIREANGLKLEWMTDGKQLINLRNISYSGKNTNLHVSFGKPVLVADAARLQIISKDLLVDGINFYNLTDRDIQVIPISSLGVEVKVIP